jgi:penicillin-binding protein 2
VLSLSCAFSKDKYNRVIGSYKDGNMILLPLQGEDINLTLDAELQKYGEQLMINKRGGIVAIEPKTGKYWSCNRSILRPFNLVGRQKSKTTPCCTTTPLQNHLRQRIAGEYPGSPF